MTTTIKITVAELADLCEAYPSYEVKVIGGDLPGVTGQCRGFKWHRTRTGQIKQSRLASFEQLLTDGTWQSVTCAAGKVSMVVSH